MNLIMDTFYRFFSTVPDKPLHHYTTMKGFLGILNNNQIWATNIFFMNDQSELRRAINLLSAELNPRIETLNREINSAQTGIDVVKLEAKMRFLKNLRAAASKVGETERKQFYVCSFTELDDTLSQWRGYSKDGNGVSISFDFRNFKGVVISKCKYDQTEQKMILKALVDHWFINLDANIEANVKDSKKDFGFGAIVSSHHTTECINSFFRIAPFFKDPKYAEEAEWRIVYAPDDDRCDIKFVPSSDVLKPYFCIHLSYLPEIQQIMIGPSAHIDLNVSSARLFLKSKGKNPDIVKKSEIPYRGRI